MSLVQPLRRLSWATVLLTPGCFGQPFGYWKLNAARSTFVGENRPKSLTVRIEPRVKGEVLTLDRTEVNGRTITSSMILYLDGVARHFQQAECSGTQSSRRINSKTIEILRDCGAGAWTRLVQRTVPESQLVLEISERRADGRRFDRWHVFEKQ